MYNDVQSLLFLQRIDANNQSLTTWTKYTV